jgi:hypothetical protein
MSRCKPALAVAALLLTACGGGHGLPVEAKQCDTLIGKNSLQVTTRIFNGAQIPVKSVRVSLDFYRDFRFTRVTGVASFKPQLEANQTRSVSLTIVSAPPTIGGQAQRCTVVHVDYADGTSANVPQ